MALTTMPGGKYDADQNPDGTWNVRDVPIVVEAEVPVGTDGETEPIDKKWMQTALAASDRRLAQDSYLAPLHHNHHGSGRDVSKAGSFKLTRIVLGTYEGEKRHKLLADLLHVDAETYADLRAGKLPYLSAEIHDITQPEIDSVALMADTVPFFRLPNLTIGRESPASQAKLEALVYGGRSNGRRQGAVLLMATGGGPVEDPREQIKAAAMAALSDAIDAIGGGEEDDAEDDAAVLDDDMMDDTPPPELGEAVPAEQEAGDDPEIEIDLEDDEDDDGSAELSCGSPKDPLDHVKAAARMDAKHSTALAASRQREAKLEARLAAIEADTAHAKMVAWAMKQLKPYNLIELDAKVEKWAGKGKAALRAFVETVKTERPIDPPTSWAGEAGALGVQTADAAFLSALPTQHHDKAQQFASEWRSARAAGYPGKCSLEDHVTICLQAEGLMAGHPDPRTN